MTSTPILDELINNIPEVCGSVGPRIGHEDSIPRCGQPRWHEGLHQGYPGSGFESERWGAPDFRDPEFAEHYRKWLAQQRRSLLDFL